MASGWNPLRKRFAVAGPDVSSQPSAARTLVADELEAWSTAILRAAGASDAAAAATARSLVDANQRGVDSHGVVFLYFYLPRLRSGVTKGDVSPEVVTDLPAFAIVDGWNGLGTHVATVAMNLCCDKAERMGAAVVAVRNSSHFGAASCYSELAARRGCIGVAMSNSDPGMAPLGALAPVLGTNPLAISSPPSPGAQLPSLDIATSVVAQGRIIAASRAGEPIPDDWALGRDGLPTADPDDALANSVLPMGGHKGFALAFMIDVLAGCLPGAGISPEIKEGPDIRQPQNVGHFFLAVHLAAGVDKTVYDESLSRLVDAVRTAPRAEWAEQFMIPGEPEVRARADRLDGIPLTEAAVELLTSLGDEYEVPFPD